MFYSPHSLQKARSRRQAQSGFTIVELSVAVAIAGVLLVSAIALVQVVLRQSRANELVSSVPRTLAQIDKMYARNADYAGLTTQVAIGFGAFDGAFDITGAAGNRVATHRFGYSTFAAPATDFHATGNGDPTAYSVIYAGIPRAACADVVSSASSSGVRGLLVAPEAVVGQAAFTVGNAGDLQLAMFTQGANNAAPAAPPAGSVMVKGTTNNSALNVAAMSGGTACGTNNDTVTIAMVNWK